MAETILVNRVEQAGGAVADAIASALAQIPKGRGAKAVRLKTAHESFAANRVTEPTLPTTRSRPLSHSPTRGSSPSSFSARSVAGKRTPRPGAF